jgi:hypothetical protein
MWSGLVLGGGRESAAIVESRLVPAHKLKNGVYFIIEGIECLGNISSSYDCRL